MWSCSEAECVKGAIKDDFLQIRSCIPYKQFVRAIVYLRIHRLV